MEDSQLELALALQIVLAMFHNDPYANVLELVGNTKKILDKIVQLAWIGDQKGVDGALKQFQEAIHDSNSMSMEAQKRTNDDGMV